MFFSESMTISSTYDTLHIVYDEIVMRIAYIETYIT